VQTSDRGLGSLSVSIQTVNEGQFERVVRVIVKLLDSVLKGGATSRLSWLQLFCQKERLLAASVSLGSTYNTKSHRLSNVLHNRVTNITE